MHILLAFKVSQCTESDDDSIIKFPFYFFFKSRDLKEIEYKSLYYLFVLFEERETGKRTLAEIATERD